MDLIAILISLALLIIVAYRGYSVILFAPISALLAVLLTDPSYVLPFFSNIFMDKMVGFIKLYFPVFLLGAIFGKIVEITGIAQNISKIIVRLIGKKRAILSVVLMGSILTYSGVSLFVVVFAIYPFASHLFRAANIPKRLIPATIAFSAFTFSMDAIPGSPQIQNVIPTSFLKTTIYAAPLLGVIGALFIITLGMLYLENAHRRAALRGEGYYGSGKNKISESEDKKLLSEFNQTLEEKITIKDWLSFIPLVVVGVMNKVLTIWIPYWYSNGFDFSSIGLKEYGSVNIEQVLAIWAVSIALILGSIVAVTFNFKSIQHQFKTSIHIGISGALLATINTASEFGFGGVIASLPGFTLIQKALTDTFSHPLVNAAVSTNVMSGMTGSGSGGMSIVLSIMAEKYIVAANTFDIPLEVMHRVIAMAAGGMDTLPHNGAVITLLLVTGLTHKQAYKDIFIITIIKTLAVFFVILVYHVTGIV